MKLYYAPGACSLADHIALLEAGAKFDAVAVDIRTKRTAAGEDFLTINPKGYVPALMLDDGDILTENVAVLDWIADRYPQLRHNGVLSRTRELEMLAFISTEVHHAFKPIWHGSEPEKEKAREVVAGLLKLAAKHMAGDYLFGDEPGVADCYLLVMLRWADKFGIAVPDTLLRLQWRMEQRPAVQAALAREEASIPHHPSSSIGRSVKENPAQHRFERPIHDGAIAVAYYRGTDDKLVFVHTEVPPAFSGQGIATDLARGTFELLRQSKRKAILKCPFLMHFYAKHPEYADIVAG
jgi:glutathione S-transferase